MSRNLMIGIVVILVVVGAGWFLLRDQMMPGSTTQMESITEPADSMMQASPEGMMESTDSSAMEGAAKEFNVTASNFKFDIPEIRVKAGDTVKINFKNSGGFHDFVLNEFNVATKQMNGPYEETVTFVADKPGTYEFYCSVGQHREMGMKGSFIVE
jgi:plastocyanin